MENSAPHHNNQNPLTVDDLAVMMKGQFDDMGKQFDDMGKQFDELKKELKLRPTQHHVDTRFDHLEKVVIEKTSSASVTRDRTLDEKTNTVAYKLENKTVFSQEDVRDKQRISPHRGFSRTITTHELNSFLPLSLQERFYFTRSTHRF